MRELSVGPEEDIVKVPNIPLLAALTKMSTKQLNTVEEMGLKTILGMTKPKEFQDKTVKEFMFGYTDSFIGSLPDMTPARAGLLSGRKGVAADNLTVFTGLDTIDNLGKIFAMNGQTKLDIWNSDECNEIVGTDGSQFPPYLMDKEQELQIFIKSFCRTLTLKYDREVTVLNGIPAWRYRAPKGEFGSSLTNPKNKCYCDAENDMKCPPDGVFDASKCLDGIPLLISYPHFLEGNETLRAHFDGLKPKRKSHETFADIHARMAFPIGGASRLQMNFKVARKESSFLSYDTYYTKLPKDLILPIFWFEVTAGEIPAEFQAIVFHTTQSANATYLAIQYGSLIGALVSLLLLLSTSYIYFIRLTRKPAEKIQNKDVVVALQSSIPNAFANENYSEVKLYPSISNQNEF
jgi:CD36 family